jgi:hypothetical protein
MTVQDLIEALQAIEDKSKQVFVPYSKHWEHVDDFRVETECSVSGDCEYLYTRDVEPEEAEYYKPAVILM